MKRRLLGSLITALLIAPLLALGAGVTTTAEASTPGPSVRRTHDARGDVLLVTERQGEDVLSPRPARRHGDVVAFRIAHRERAVIATITMRSLTRHDRLFGAVLQLRTASARYTAVLYRSGVRQPLTSRFDGGGTHGCDRMSFDVDHADDTVTISVPRSCLGDPAWVASRAVIDYFGPSGLGSGFFADAAPGSGLSHIPFLPKAWHPRG